MKRLFFSGALLLVLFEAANVYFIMPLPYSQRARSIDVAYFLYSWRWAFRAVAGALMLAGVPSAWRAAGWRKLVVAFSLAGVAAVAYATNFVMSADHIFRQPQSVVMRPAAQNTVEPPVSSSASTSTAKPVPIPCSSSAIIIRCAMSWAETPVPCFAQCRTGRVLRPSSTASETFRLVGMDHFNAMFEDRTTRSWWRQATGEASRDHARESRFRRSRADR
jgi:hypothetical protein